MKRKQDVWVGKKISVVVSVSGGVAEVAYCPPMVDVDIVDMDDLEAEGMDSDERDEFLRVSVETAKAVNK